MHGKVSMVIPCYNKVNYISNMFDSIIAQEWDNIELILVNDGSTDGTREIIAEYETKFRYRGFEVIIVDQKNSGVCAAAKAGLERITGDFVCMVDADDELDPKYVSTMARWLEEHEEYDYVACEGILYKIVDNTKFFRQFTPMEIVANRTDILVRWLLSGFRTTVWIYMVRLSYFHKCRILETYYTQNKGSHEPGYVIPLLSYGGRLKYFPLPLYHFNKSGIGHSQLYIMMKLKSFAKSIINYAFYQYRTYQTICLI